MAELNSALTVCLSDIVRISLIASETDGRAGHSKKQTVRGPSTSHLSWIQDSVAPVLFKF